MEIDSNNLDNNTHYEIRQSVAFLIFKIFFLELGITLLHLLIDIIIPSHGLHDLGIGILNGGTWEVISFHIISTSLIIYFALQRATTYYVIGNKEIKYQTGIILKHKVSYNHHGIEKIEMNQTFIGRIFNYGNISIENPYIMKELSLKGIPNPDYYVGLINLIHQKKHGGEAGMIMNSGKNMTDKHK